MASFNKVLLLGNLTRDLQLRYLPSGTAVVDFGLAMNQKWKNDKGEDREEVCFVECTCFGGMAETLNKHTQKGHRLLVEGRLKYEQWEDKDTKAKRHTLKVVVESFQFLQPKQNGESK